MMQFNFTLVVEMVLFLVFLGVANRFFLRPLRRVMDEREAKLKEDKVSAASNAAEAQRLDQSYIELLTEADQTAAQNLRQARYDAYQEHRTEIDTLRQQSDAEVDVFRSTVERQMAEEKQRYAALIPGLAEAMDRQIRTEGSVR